MSLKRGVDYGAVIRTSCGDIRLDLLESAAPVAVNNFIFLARRGFYNGLTWHRVERNSVIQAGDPNGQNGTPPDGPGYTIADSLPAKARMYVYGVVGLANSGRPGTGGSQFFIVVHDLKGALKGHAQPAGYAPLYTIFGRVDKASYGTLERISKQQTKGGVDPVLAVEPKVPIYIDSITITEH
jgi:peptidylprolyl isomerase